MSDVFEQEGWIYNDGDIFTKIPKKIHSYTKDAYAMSILIFLMDLSNKEYGYAWPSLNTITKETGISRSAVKNKLKLLKDLGLLKVISGKRKDGSGKNKVNNYIIHFPRNVPGRITNNCESGNNEPAKLANFDRAPETLGVGHQKPPIKNYLDKELLIPSKEGIAVSDESAKTQDSFLNLSIPVSTLYPKKKIEYTPEQLQSLFTPEMKDTIEMISDKRSIKHDWTNPTQNLIDSCQLILKLKNGEFNTVINNLKKEELALYKIWAEKNKVVNLPAIPMDWKEVRKVVLKAIIRHKRDEELGRSKAKVTFSQFLWNPKSDRPSSLFLKYFNVKQAGPNDYDLDEMRNSIPQDFQDYIKKELRSWDEEIKSRFTGDNEVKFLSCCTMCLKWLETHKDFLIKTNPKKEYVFNDETRFLKIFWDWFDGYAPGYKTPHYAMFKPYDNFDLASIKQYAKEELQIDLSTEAEYKKALEEELDGFEHLLERHKTIMEAGEERWITIMRNKSLRLYCTENLRHYPDTEFWPEYNESKWERFILEYPEEGRKFEKFRLEMLQKEKASGWENFHNGLYSGFGGVKESLRPFLVQRYMDSRS